ncbi:MAG TPA: amidase family protein [Candidatus Acidoferrales bacterium]|nr:amidase family protein [Candidatus Acidoferrales bacterium]
MRSPVMRILVLAALLVPCFAAAQNQNSAPTTFDEATIAQLQADMTSGNLTSERLTQFYIQRILSLDQKGPGVNSVIQLNPDALALARNADSMRRHGATTAQFPLLGIPVLLKDNIDTGDKMQTTAGSFALFGAPALQDSTVAANLRRAGAVILGKTGLSEWANFRSFFSTSGWSGRGGLVHNPYSLDRNACGSSSGSGAAASANFTAVSLGSETDGSIVCPASVNGVVGIKPTVGLVSRGGVVPISHNQDTVGPHARTVADAAATLSAIVSRIGDPRDPLTSGVPLGWQACSPTCSSSAPLPGKNRPVLPADYRAFLDPAGLNGARLGVTRQGVDNSTPQVVAAFDAAIAAIKNAGATIVDLDDPSNNFSFSPADGELFVLLYDFKFDVGKYFGTRAGVPVAGGTLQTAIDFDNADAAQEMPYFGQEIFTLAETMNPDPNFCDPRFTSAVLPSTATCMSYNDALIIDHLAGASLDSALSQFGLDAIVAPTSSPGWTTDLILTDHFIFASSGLAGPPGYPIINVPAANVLGMPMGISFFGTAFSEPTLIKLASGFEAVTHARFEPTFSGNVTAANTSGTTLVHPPKMKAPPKKAPHHI